MILYTPLSPTDIFPHSDDEYLKRQCVSFQGRTVYAEKKDDGSFQLLQLLSSDPQDFLNASYSPGTILS